jgi:hypothetical protein
MNPRLSGTIHPKLPVGRMPMKITELLLAELDREAVGSARP